MEPEEPTTTIATAELQRIAAQMEALRLGNEEVERAAAAAAAAAAHAPVPTGRPARLKHPSAPTKRYPTKAEVEQFLWSANIFHTATNTAPDQRVMVTRAYLADPDAQWLRVLCTTREEAGLPTWLDWATFAQDLTARHTSATHYDNVRDQFAAIHQTGSVTTYIAGLNQLVLQIPDLGTAERRSTFLRGPKPHIKTQVYLQPPRGRGPRSRDGPRREGGRHHLQPRRPPQPPTASRHAPTVSRRLPGPRAHAPTVSRHL